MNKHYICLRANKLFSVELDGIIMLCIIESKKKEDVTPQI